MLLRCIAGFQTGSDLAGIKAALDSGLQVGGWMPRGFKTLDGPKPEYEQLYNAKECSSESYKVRTYANVASADATLRFALDFNSSGEICTKKAIDYYNKPYADVHILNTSKFEVDPNDDPHEIAKWIHYFEFTTLNIAGNSEKTAPGIEKWVYKYLMKMFKELQEMENDE